jgi:hypothetical protein
MTIENVEQTGKFGQIVAYITKQEMKNEDSKYQLMDSNKITLKRLELVTGTSIKVYLYRDDEKMNFEIGEEEFNSDFFNKFALSFIEDAKIASIYNGNITAKIKGSN